MSRLQSLNLSEESTSSVRPWPWSVGSLDALVTLVKRECSVRAVVASNVGLVHFGGRHRVRGWPEGKKLVSSNINQRFEPIQGRCANDNEKNNQEETRWVRIPSFCRPVCTIHFHLSHPLATRDTLRSLNLDLRWTTCPRTSSSCTVRDTRGRRETSAPSAPWRSRFR